MLRCGQSGSSSACLACALVDPRGAGCAPARPPGARAAGRRALSAGDATRNSAPRPTASPATARHLPPATPAEPHRSLGSRYAAPRRWRADPAAHRSDAQAASQYKRIRLRRREAPHHLRQHGFQQVANARKREPCVRRRRLALEHRIATPPRRLHAFATTPSSCDNGLALKHQGPRPALERLDKDATAAISRSWPTTSDRLSATTPSRPYGLKRGAGRVPVQTSQGSLSQCVGRQQRMSTPLLLDETGVRLDPWLTAPRTNLSSGRHPTRAAAPLLLR